MKGMKKFVGGLVVASSISVLMIGAAVAQDPTVVDPNGVAVFVTDGQIKFGLPDGKSQDAIVKAGQAMFAPAGKHLPENVGDKTFEVVLVELKSK